MEKRTHYLIDKWFQEKFMLEFCGLNLLAAVVIGALVYWLNRQTNTVAFEDLQVVAKSTSDFILPTVVQVLVVSTILVSVATIFVVLFMTHKISGPLFHLKIEMEHMKRGDLSQPVRVRIHDELKDVAEELESLRVKLRQDIGSLKEAGAKMSAGQNDDTTRTITEMLAHYKTE